MPACPVSPSSSPSSVQEGRAECGGCRNVMCLPRQETMYRAVLYTTRHEGPELSWRPWLWTVHSAGRPTFTETGRLGDEQGQAGHLEDRGGPGGQHRPLLPLEAGSKTHPLSVQHRCPFVLVWGGQGIQSSESLSVS